MTATVVAERAKSMPGIVTSLAMSAIGVAVIAGIAPGAIMAYWKECVLIAVVLAQRTCIVMTMELIAIRVGSSNLLN